MTATTDRSLVTSIETYSGHYIDYLDPKPAQIELADIARGLAQTCRYAAQTTVFYSVAEHAVRVAELVRQAVPNCTAELVLAALHHDSHEAYLGDWPSPLKHVFGSELLKSLAWDLDYCVATKFGFRSALFDAKAVKAADQEMLRREAATLKYSHGVGPHWSNDTHYPPLAGIGWSPDRAERKFLEAHEREMQR